MPSEDAGDRRELMKSLSVRSLTLFALLLLLATAVVAQPKKASGGPGLIPTPQLVRTTTRHEVRRLPYGSTLTIIGPPDRSITIEGWQRNEVDVSPAIQF